MTTPLYKHFGFDLLRFQVLFGNQLSFSLPAYTRVSVTWRAEPQSFTPVTSQCVRAPELQRGPRWFWATSSCPLPACMKVRQKKNHLGIFSHGNPPWVQPWHKLELIVTSLQGGTFPSAWEWLFLPENRVWSVCYHRMACPWAFLGKGQPQLLWETSVRPSSPSQPRISSLYPI